MKTIKCEIDLYELNELDKQARARAIEDHRCFMLETLSFNDFDGTEEEKRLDYNAVYKDIEENDEQVINSIELNEYLFYYNGELANITTYIESGITEFKFLDKKIIL